VPVSLVALFRVFLAIGATAFGGLAPSLAVIERELVSKHRALTAQDIAEATAITRVLPGSTLIQVVSFLGYRLRGWRGSALATLACILPPASAMLLLAVGYDFVLSLPLLRSGIQGVAAAVVGLLVAMAYRTGRAILGDPIRWGIALSAFLSSALMGIPSGAVVVAAGLIGIPLLCSGVDDRRPGTGKGDRR
jgi:chromate transporter